jgi:hypothetical protein
MVCVRDNKLAKSCTNRSLMQENMRMSSLPQHPARCTTFCMGRSTCPTPVNLAPYTPHALPSVYPPVRLASLASGFPAGCGAWDAGRHRHQRRCTSQEPEAMHEPGNRRDAWTRQQQWQSCYQEGNLRAPWQAGWQRINASGTDGAAYPAQQRPGMLQLTFITCLHLPTHP